MKELKKRKRGKKEKKKEQERFKFSQYRHIVRDISNGCVWCTNEGEYTQKNERRKIKKKLTLGMC